MKHLLLTAACVMLLMSCQTDDTDSAPNPRTDIQLSAEEKNLVEIGNDFAFKLFRQVHADEDKPNFFISPLSAGLALGMTTNGAVGETEAGMMKTLGFEGVDVSKINNYYKKMVNGLLAADNKTELGVANSIWIRQELPVIADFVTVNKDVYNAEVQRLDFAAPSSLATINNWCATKTAGRIPTIIDRVSKDDAMYLINALYFKGNWTQKFNEKNTSDKPFYGVDGHSQNVKMMQGEMKLRYAGLEDYELLELPYGNEAFSMIVLLPNENQSIHEVAASLSLTAWNEGLRHLRQTTVNVQLPRFKLEYEKELNEPLKQMGMDLAFTPQADFSKITPGGGLMISFVKQKTFVEVDEVGSEAAAATVVSMELSSAADGKLYFTADHPFLYAIREQSTGCILFIGKVGKL